MAHFYASIQGGKGTGTRTGTKNSGIRGHIRGWDVGAKVTIHHEDGKDVVRVYKTGGSSERGSDTLIATFTADDL